MPVEDGGLVFDLPSKPIRNIRMRTWNESRFSKMRGRAEERVNAYGKRLIEYGFKQSPNKPYIFLNQTKNGVRFMVDLGGTEKYPTRPSMRAYVYPFGSDRRKGKWNPELEKDIRDVIVNRIGVPCYQPSFD
jgi:hypothetical protein